MGTLTFYKLWSSSLKSFILSLATFQPLGLENELDIFLGFEEVAYCTGWLMEEINRRQFVLSLESQTVATIMCNLRWGRCRRQENGWESQQLSRWHEGNCKSTYCSLAVTSKPIFASTLDKHLSCSNKIELNTLIIMPCMLFFSFS